MSKYWILVLFAFSFNPWAQACQAPTAAESRSFFNGNSDWTLVNGPNTNMVHDTKEVIFALNFQTPSRSIVNWNGGRVNVRNLQVCKTESPHVMEIKSNWPRVRVTRLRGGWLQAKALGIKFYLYPSLNVVWD